MPEIVLILRPFHCSLYQVLLRLMLLTFQSHIFVFSGFETDLKCGPFAFPRCLECRTNSGYCF